MSNRHIEPTQILTTRTVSGVTPVRSNPLDMRTISRGAIHIIYGSGLTATFAIEGSVDGTTYRDIGVSIAAAAGTAGDALIDLSQFGFAYFKALITPSSGSGTVTVWANGKGF